MCTHGHPHISSHGPLKTSSHFAPHIIVSSILTSLCCGKPSEVVPSFPFLPPPLHPSILITRIVVIVMTVFSQMISRLTKKHIFLKKYAAPPKYPCQLPQPLQPLPPPNHTNRSNCRTPHSLSAHDLSHLPSVARRTNFVALPFLLVMLFARDGRAWKQSNPWCAEKHTVVAAHVSQNFTRSTEFLTTVTDFDCRSISLLE